MDGQRLICIKYSTLLRTENHSLPYKTSRRFVFLNNSYRENNLRDVTSHPDKKMPDLVQARRIMPKNSSLLSSVAWRSWTRLRCRKNPKPENCLKCAQSPSSSVH